jgi:hypothetical protein
MDHKEVWWENVDWVYLAQDSDKWQALMNPVIKIGFRKIRGIFLTRRGLLVSQE